MKASIRLLKHTIKFVGGPHPVPKPHAAGPHPLAPKGVVPGSVGMSSSSSSSSSGSQSRSFHHKSPVEPQNGEFFSRSELPKRFRYPTIKDWEIDQVSSGGADVVF
ncbi:hypothetical protein KGF57_004226 [Candida theae]|uniref:37S ribosomal protein YMR-31, mitochondrial n=1 Tax=Candida theae TaxID=1198502 RepID=A0AAD5FX97_9ASCO|nr:uncharacterized protein KGF57_004226 [Candida theae]KAI5950678.1 hypothetical protein KGF57_004226 [Candida theae]